MQALTAPKKEKEKSGIQKWARDDRPREKLLDKGPQYLSDAELLGILILNGTRTHNAIDLARIILQKHGNSLQGLSKCTVQDLVNMKIPGIRRAKAATIVAAMELVRRSQADFSPENVIIRDSREAAQYLRMQLAHLQHEAFGVLYLNQAGGLNHFEILSQGGITSTTVDSRLIFKKALRENAVSIIVGHNHPSGNLRPSQADQALTEKIRQGAAYLNIRLLDHIIVGESGYFSFANEGLLQPYA